MVFRQFPGNVNFIRYGKYNHNIIYFNHKIYGIGPKYLFHLNLLGTVFQMRSLIKPFKLKKNYKINLSSKTSKVRFKSVRNLILEVLQSFKNFVKIYNKFDVVLLR